MELERRLRRVELRKPSGHDRRYIFIKTLFLEDLIAIHKAIDSTRGDAKIERKKSVDFWESRIAEQNARIERGETSEPPLTMPALYQGPLIKMNNNEFEFDSLDEVESIRRAYFEEFRFSNSSDSSHFWVWISKYSCVVSTSDDDEQTTHAIEDIDRVFKRRQSILTLVAHTKWFVAGFTGFAFIPLVGARIEQPSWVSSTITLVCYGLLLVLILYMFIIPPLRRRVVVPRFRSDAESFWDKWGNALIGAAATILVGIATVLLTK